jgi:hypothetical protein
MSRQPLPPLSHGTSVLQQPWHISEDTMFAAAVSMRSPLDTDSKPRWMTASQCWLASTTRWAITSTPARSTLKLLPSMQTPATQLPLSCIATSWEGFEV